MATDKITFMANVHTGIGCRSCDFRADDYTSAVKDAEAHHRKTGHELEGERGLAVWIGEEGRQMLEEHTERMMKALFGPDYTKPE